MSYWGFSYPVLFSESKIGFDAAELRWKKTLLNKTLKICLGLQRGVSQYLKPPGVKKSKSVSLIMQHKLGLNLKKTLRKPHSAKSILFPPIRFGATACFNNYNTHNPYHPIAMETTKHFTSRPHLLSSHSSVLMHSCELTKNWKNEFSEQNYLVGFAFLVTTETLK